MRVQRQFEAAQTKLENAHTVSLVAGVRTFEGCLNAAIQSEE